MAKERKRKKKETEEDSLFGEKFQQAKEAYLTELKSNPTYSLIVDSENKYNFTDEQKEFIGLYCEFKNLNLAANLSNLGFENALVFYKTYECQQEIRRMNIAAIHQQFKTKMLSIEEIGSYLSSLIVDNVPSGDRISSTEKVKVAEKLVYIHELLSKGFTNPQQILEADVDEELKDLSLDALKRLLENNKSKESIEERDKIIEEIESYNILSDEEIMLLKSLSVSQLNELIDEIEKKLQKN